MGIWFLFFNKMMNHNPTIRLFIAIEGRWKTEIVSEKIYKTSVFLDCGTM